MNPAPPDLTVLDPVLRDWLRPVVGEVELVRPLIGGITATMLQLRATGSGADLVLRRWGGDAHEEEDPVERERDALTALAGTGIPVPQLLAADADGSAVGCPTTLTTFLPGTPQLAPPDLRSFVRELAGMLVRIHAVSAPGLRRCLPWTSSDLSWLEVGDGGLAREAAALTAAPPDPARAVFSHGDYQHFNILWQGEQVGAVVDWPCAGSDDRGRDVGHCRLNLAVLFSADAAMWFLEDYEQIAGVVVDPAADVLRLLGYGRDWPEFIPVQVAGRAVVDGAGMPERVRETLERTLRRAG